MELNKTRFILILVLCAVLAVMAFNHVKGQTGEKNPTSEVVDIELGAVPSGSIEEPIRFNKTEGEITIIHSSSVPSCREIELQRHNLNEKALYIDLTLEDNTEAGVECTSNVIPSNIKVDVIVEGKLPPKVSLNDHYQENQTYRLES